MSDQDEKKYLIDADLAKRIVGYLSSKPYAEVYMLIEEIKQMRQLGLREDSDG